MSEILYLDTRRARLDFFLLQRLVPHPDRCRRESERIHQCYRTLLSPGGTELTTTPALVVSMPAEDTLLLINSEKVAAPGTLPISRIAQAVLDAALLRAEFARAGRPFKIAESYLIFSDEVCFRHQVTAQTQGSILERARQLVEHNATRPDSRGIHSPRKLRSMTTQQVSALWTNAGQQLQLQAVQPMSAAVAAA